LAVAVVVLSVFWWFPKVAASAETSGTSNRDFAVFLFSDVHVGAENLKANPPVTAADSFAKAKGNLEITRGLVGQPYPERPELRGLVPSTIPRPRALIILGDLTDGHKEPARQEEQWRSFEALFPVTGVVFGDATVPAIALAGNHDGDVFGPQRRGLVRRNEALRQAGELTALSSNGVHFAANWQGIHLVGLGLCAADTTDSETPFKYGQPGAGSWNDPQGAFSFLKEYLERTVGKSGEPVILMQHYGFDGFSMNDWNWWTPKQRRALYDLLKDYNIAAILHGHNHHAEHYRWPDPKQHAADLDCFFGGKPPASFRQYDVLSCGSVGWLVRMRGDQLIAVHFNGPDWPTDSAKFFLKSLKP
jgi:3',5'-cyclic AMP phosphodiesterase CpdA